MPSTNLEKHRIDLKALIERGKTMRLDLSVRHDPDAGGLASENLRKYEEQIKGRFEIDYQAWYSETLALLEQILPSRRSEFIELYLAAPKRKTVNVLSYTIQDWMLGVRAATNILTHEKNFDDLAVTLLRFSTQLEILKSAERKFESSLFEIRQILRADLFDSELDEATELLANGFVRASGAIAGVVLEKHLLSICDARNLKLKKSHPTIATLNDELKTASVYEVPMWRFIQRLGDLRNMCDHGKGRDPSKDEATELIEGTKRVTKSVY